MNNSFEEMVEAVENKEYVATKDFDLKIEEEVERD